MEWIEWLAVFFIMLGLWITFLFVLFVLDVVFWPTIYRTDQWTGCSGQDYYRGGHASSTTYKFYLIRHVWGPFWRKIDTGDWHDRNNFYKFKHLQAPRRGLWKT